MNDETFTLRQHNRTSRWFVVWERYNPQQDSWTVLATTLRASTYKGGVRSLNAIAKAPLARKWQEYEGSDNFGPSWSRGQIEHH